MRAFCINTWIMYSTHSPMYFSEQCQLIKAADPTHDGCNSHRSFLHVRTMHAGLSHAFIYKSCHGPSWEGGCEVAMEVSHHDRFLLIFFHSRRRTWRDIYDPAL